MQFSGQRGEVHLLEVTRRLERHGVIGLTAGVVAVHNVCLIPNGNSCVGAAQRAHRAGGIVGIGGMGVAETDVEEVVAVDVPVDTGQHFIVGSAERVVLITAGIVSELVGEELMDIVHLRHRRTVVTGASAKLLTLIRACLDGGAGLVVNRIFTVDEEEQFVFDDGAA